MSTRQRVAAYMGLVGLVVGIVGFVVFAWPVIREDLWGDGGG